MNKNLFYLVLTLPLVLTTIAHADKGGRPHWQNPGHPHYQERSLKHCDDHYDRSDYHKGKGRDGYSYWPSSNYRPRSGYDHYDRPAFNQDFDKLRYGVRSGRLSYREESELKARLNDLRDQEHRYLRDGQLSWREREDMRRAAEDLRKRLEHELRDGEYR